MFVFAANIFPLFADPVSSFPNYDRSHFVFDKANVIDDTSRGSLESLCRELEAKTSTELVIATVGTTAPLVPKEYVVKLFEKWKVGKKGKDNGMLMLVSITDRRVEVETGYGIEGILPDGKVGKILRDNVIPFFKEGNYGLGILSGASQLADEVAISSGAKLAPVFIQQKTDLFTAFFGWGLVIFFSGVIIYWIYCIATNAPVWRSAIPGGIIGFFVGIIDWNIISVILNTAVAYLMTFAVSFVVQKLMGNGSVGTGSSGGGDSGGGGGGDSGGGGGDSGGGGAGASW